MLPWSKGCYCSTHLSGLVRAVTWCALRISIFSYSIVYSGPSGSSTCSASAAPPPGLGGAALQDALGVELAVSHAEGDEGGIGDQELGGWLQYQYAPHQLKGKVALGAIPVLPMRHILPWEVQRDPAAMGCAAPAAPAAAMAMGRWGLPRKALRRWRSGDGRYQGRACRPRRAMGGRW